MIRATALQQAHASACGRIGLTPEQFAEQMKGWEVFPVYSGTAVVGAVMVYGNELHIGVTRLPPGSNRCYVRILQQVIEKHGSAVTKVMKGNEVGLRFCLRLGFVVQHENEGVVFLRCERCNHA